MSRLSQHAQSITNPFPPLPGGRHGNPPGSNRRAISQLLRTERGSALPALLAAGARLKDCAAEYNRFRVGHTASSEWEGNLKEHVRHTLGSMAIPSEIAFVEKLPKTSSSKIMRRLLKAQEFGREIGDISSLEE